MEQHATTPEIRPGFARRTSGFSKLVSQAQAYEPNPELTKDAIFRAMAFGLADMVSDKEYRFLCVAVSMLNRRSLEGGHPRCYISGFVFRKLLGGVSERTLSRIKRNLERMGLIIRHYDKRNRPLEKAGIDLRPLLFRLDELQERADRLFESSRVHFEEQQRLDEHNYDDKSVLVGGRQSPPNSLIPTLPSYTVQTEDKKESPPKAPIFNHVDDCQNDNRTGSAEEAAIHAEPSSTVKDCSPMEISDFWRDRGKLRKGLSSKARSELLEAHRLSPSLQNYLDAADIEKGDIKRVYDACLELIRVHFNPQRNGGETFKWAVNKFNWHAVQILVSALEDPSVQSPEKWFGWAVTKMEPGLDLSSNFRRIRNFLETPEPEDTEPENGSSASCHPSQNLEQIGTETSNGEGTEIKGQSDPHGELMSRARRVMAEKTFANPSDIDSWFENVSVVKIIEGQILLGAPSKFFVDHIRDCYVDSLAETFTELLGRPVTPIITLAMNWKNH